MHSLEELQELFEGYLKEQSFNRKPTELYEPFSYMLSIGGKRMRPMLLLMAYEMFGKDAKDVLSQAFSIELFHNFTLVHDDIMDNASMRRGAKTVHTKYNSNVAILSGDVMLIYAYEYLRKSKPETLPFLLSIFNETAIQVCEGQQFDMNFESRNDVTVDEYINMIQLKTAVVLGASLKSGAMLAGADKATQQCLYDFGKYTGTAFQLSDDILDSYSDQQKFGKQTGGDIIQNKKTILLLQALKHANESQKEELNNWLSRKDFNAEEKIKAVLRLYDETGAVNAAREMIHSYHEQALLQLDEVNIPSANKRLLYDFAGMLTQRQA